MKVIYLILLSVITLPCFSQSIDSCGLDNSPILSRNEANFLNAHLKDEIKEFDFQTKKIAYYTWQNGGKITNKQSYFSTQKRLGKYLYSHLTVFNQTEKAESGGYDAIVVYYSRVKPLVRIKKIVKELSKV
jgi:hypothetical protein